MTMVNAWNRYRFVLLTVLAFGLTSLISESAQAANGGSWGSSRGGFASSGGSWGSGLSGRQPIRNLLGRVGSRLSGFGNGSSGGSSGGSLGSNGGRVGNGGLLGRRSYGSTGGWGSSGGYSSMGSSGGYVSASTGSYASSGGSWGSSYSSSYPSTITNYSVPSMGYSLESSYPVGDYGFESGYPMQTEYPMDGSFIGDAPILDGGSIDSMLPVEAPGYYTEPAAGSGNAVEPPGPSSDDGTSTSVPNTDSSVLNVVLPAEAQVFINGQLTNTQGTLRSYRSKNLSVGQEYKYQVKAVLVSNGQEMVKTELVTMTPGVDETIRFQFEETVAELPAPVTTLALKVPADAKVTLCGNQTYRVGAVRTFTTETLQPGKIWKDYTVEVEFERDGKIVKEERSLDMVAGETYSLTIGTEIASTDLVATN